MQPRKVGSATDRTYPSDNPPDNASQLLAGCMTWYATEGGVELPVQAFRLASSHGEDTRNSLQFFGHVLVLTTYVMAGTALRSHW